MLIVGRVKVGKWRGVWSYNPVDSDDVDEMGCRDHEPWDTMYLGPFELSCPVRCGRRLHLWNVQILSRVQLLQESLELG